MSRLLSLRKWTALQLQKMSDEQPLKLPGSILYREKNGSIEARLKLHKQYAEVLGIRTVSGYGKTRILALESLERKLQPSEKPVDSRTLRSYMETVFIPGLTGKAWISQVRWAMTHISLLDIPLSSLNRHEIQMMLNRLAKPGFSATSVGHVRKVMRAALELAAIDGHIDSNPAAYTKVRKGARKAQQWTLSSMELRKAIRAAHINRRAGLAPLVFSGLMGMGWDEIRVCEVRPNGTIEIPEAKNDYRVRVLPIPKNLFPYIAHLRPPFISGSNSSVHAAIKRVTDPLKIKKPGRHTLRHTCSTMLQDMECPREVRDMILGHSTKGMAGHYSHSQMMKSKREWLTKLVDAVLYSEVVEEGGNPLENGA